MKRMSGPARRVQIAEAALQVIARYGLQGATTSRIAEAAGVSPAALYKHFHDRRQLLLAALDLLYDRIQTRLFESIQEPNVIERLRYIGSLHRQLLESEQDYLLYPFVEFLAAPVDSGLREAQGARQLEMIAVLARIIEEGKAQGSVRPEVDSEQVAWVLHAIYWVEDIAQLMGLSQFVTAGRSKTMLNDILTSIATRSPVEAETIDFIRLKKLLALCPLVAESPGTAASHPSAPEVADADASDGPQESLSGDAPSE